MHTLIEEVGLDLLPNNLEEQAGGKRENRSSTKLPQIRCLLYLEELHFELQGGPRRNGLPAAPLAVCEIGGDD